MEIYDIDAGKFTASVKVGKSPMGVAVHQSTGTIYVAAASRRQIYVSAWSGNDANDGAFDRPVRTFDRTATFIPMKPAAAESAAPIRKPTAVPHPRLL